MKNIAIFASGNGTNAENIIKYFKRNPEKGTIQVVITNNSKAKVIERANLLGVETLVFKKEIFANNPEQIIEKLDKYHVHLIVLAGFMLLLPDCILNKYEKRIINIHPSLLPKFGGKGMYGSLVHKAVIESKEKKSGITIHYIDSEYDKGEIIFQACCKVSDEDTAESLERKIHQLEYKYYPLVISKILNI